jgi:phosphoribosyl-AMP cyclohydrolase / phosphoribosyl-ATP pyrophosphohydrolase
MRDRNAPLSATDIASLDWHKMDGLLPAVVQDRVSGRVLMLGYMNDDALAATLDSGFVTFFSRSKQRLWQKGESSGNRLQMRAVHADCDSDALLVIADPQGPTCHTGTLSCFGDEALTGAGWLGHLAAIVRERAVSGDAGSYTRKLLADGPARIAQKVGEEAVEVALAAVARDVGSCAEETADLLYHLTVLMEVKGFGWAEVIDLLKARHSAASSSTAAS